MQTRRKVSEMTLDELTMAVKAIVEPSFLELKNTLANIEISIQGSQSALDVVKKKTELHQHKLAEFEQRERARSVRILNLELTKELQRSPAQLGKYLYQNFFLPCLNAAKNQNILDDVPACIAVVEWCHPLGQDSTNPDGSARPAAIICKFATRLVKSMVMTNKRSVLEAFNRGLVKQVRIVDDTSYQTRQNMSRIREMEGVLTVFFANQKIKYKTTDNPDRVMVARNPDGRTISELQDPNPLMADD